MTDAQRQALRKELARYVCRNCNNRGATLDGCHPACTTCGSDDLAYAPLEDILATDPYP